MARRADSVRPPPGLFRIRWVRSFPSLNEFFVHHEDVRRANGLGPRNTLTPALEAALWRNVCRGSRYLSRRLDKVGLEVATIRTVADCARMASIRSAAASSTCSQLSNTNNRTLPSKAAATAHSRSYPAVE